MGVKLSNTGVFIDAEEVVCVKIQNQKGNYVQFFNYGLILQCFVVENKNGLKQDIVLGFDAIQDYLSAAYLKNYPYMGTIIGRYANRIKNSHFTLDGVNYKLYANAGSNCLHGGKKGFDKQIWKLQVLDEETVLFKFHSKDGAEGFPGDLSTYVKITFTAHDELKMDFQCTTSTSTVLNLTHHSYFNLDAGGGNIGNHQHFMNASNYLAQDKDLTVTGEMLKVNASLDFRAAKNIQKDWDLNEGYDQSFLIDGWDKSIQLASKTVNSDRDLELSIYTTEPCIQFYTAKSLNVIGGKNGKSYLPFHAFCIEAQHCPNSVNIPNFPTTRLNVGEVYSQTTIYAVKVVN